MTEDDEKRLAARLRAHADNGTCPSSSEMREAADALDTERAERARVERELQRISFASGNVGIEHPEWPPEYARHVAALIARATQAESALAAARVTCTIEHATMVAIRVGNRPTHYVDFEREELAEELVAALTPETP